MPMPENPPPMMRIWVCSGRGSIRVLLGNEKLTSNALVSFENVT